MKHVAHGALSGAIYISVATGSFAQDPARFPLETLTQDVQVSGFVNGSYLYGVNSPDSGENTGRVFDRDANSFTLNAAEVALQKPGIPGSPIGFRMDLYAGEDAKIIHAAGLGEAGDAFDLQQAYGEISATDQLLIKAGKFVTLAGAEVIESKDNWNMSRSFLFGYAIPFTHTGVRASYTLENTWDFILGVNNGWDVADDNNDGKTIETHIGFNNIELPDDSSLTIALQGYFGPETAQNDSNWRSLGDLVVTYKPAHKPLTLMYNFDYANDDDALGNGQSANWWGHAGYLKYQLNDVWALAGRAEYMNDEDGVRIVSGTGAKYTSWTGTVDYRGWNNIIARLEARMDDANTDVFGDDSVSGLTDTQTTFGGELIYFFG